MLNLTEHEIYPAVKMPTIGILTLLCRCFSDFIWDFGKLPFPAHLGKYFIKIGKIRAKIHEIGKIKAIFGLGMTPIYGLKNGQIKSLCLNKKNLYFSPFSCF